MTDNNGRADHIEDALVTLGIGNWFGWRDTNNKVYSNLILHPKIWNKDYTGTIHEEGMIDNPYTKPTEEELNTKLKELQDAWDAANS